jgi:FlaG/FlaF family flagellin (archaellin)
MFESNSGRHFRNGKHGRIGVRGRAWRSRRAVSDVVATILLLALTVVLFASIFAFVSSFPSPPPQNSNQFQAQIITASNGSSSMALAISILHLAGPAVPASSLIYLKSSQHPLGPEFANAYSLTAGGLPAGQVWNLGQTWYLSSNFTGTCHPVAICHPILPDNLTVYIVAGPLLLFSAVIPGFVLNLPPTYLSAQTNLATPAVGEAFKFQAVIQGITNINTVTIGVSGLPLASQPATTQKMWDVNGVWTYNETAGNTTASGTYYAFITATTNAGKVGTTAVPVYITPFSTLIANALVLASPAVLGAAKCTAAQAPVAACQASGDYYATVTLTTSYVTLGSVLFEVQTTATRVAYTTAGHAAFALALTSTPTVVAASWVDSVVTGPLVMPTSGFTTITGPLTTLSPLTTLYTISIDLGTATPGSNTLSFLVLGNGAYSSQTAALTIP